MDQTYYVISQDYMPEYFIDGYDDIVIKGTLHESEFNSVFTVLEVVNNTDEETRDLPLVGDKIKVNYCYTGDEEIYVFHNSECLGTLCHENIYLSGQAKYKGKKLEFELQQFKPANEYEKTVIQQVLQKFCLSEFSSIALKKVST